VRPPGPHVTAVASVLVALVLLVLHARRALHFLFPGMRVEADTPADQMDVPEALAPLAASLANLGFTALGTHEEQALLTPATHYFDYVQGSVFASLHEDAEHGGRVDFWTPAEGGGFVVTSNYARHAVEQSGRYRAGGLEGAALERVLKAHQKRAEFCDIEGEFTWEGRVRMAHAWHASYGRAELRRQNLPGLLWCIAAIAILLSALEAWAGSSK